MSAQTTRRRSRSPMSQWTIGSGAAIAAAPVPACTSRSGAIDTTGAADPDAFRFRALARARRGRGLGGFGATGVAGAGALGGFFAAVVTGAAAGFASASRGDGRLA